MFEKLGKMLTSGAPLNEQYNQFVEMLNADKDLFNVVIDAFRGVTDLDDIEGEVYKTDIKINKAERAIRKKLVSHLALNPERDIAGALVLMSVVKDAERVGDFCKNLYEAAVMVRKQCSELYFCDKITEYTEYVRETFNVTIKAFETEDVVMAAEILQDEIIWNKRFDNLLTALADSDISTREAVCTTLFVRGLKRIQSHLANIASSIGLPVHEIDHRPKNLRD
ncbi:MAG: hypothetical protein HOD92_21850 [Deltaproteobacteria bacterium]|nr:hypothetical protein [Deltaproteobacteria bacterium]